jgi:hypothetical protein
VTYFLCSEEFEEQIVNIILYPALCKMPHMLLILKPYCKMYWLLLLGGVKRSVPSTAAIL